MTFTEVLDQQQTRIDAARDRYRECNRKLNHLINQIQAADAWDAYAVANLNKQLEIAGNETQAAMQAWDLAIDADIPKTAEHSDTATMAEWLDAVRLMPQGYRIKDGWFHDSNGRCNTPSGQFTRRQIDILTGVISVR